MARKTHLLLKTLYASSPEYSISWVDETQWQPRVDVYQTDTDYLIHVEAAGVQEEKLQLHFNNGTLLVVGERLRPDLPCPQHCLQVEISYGPFQRHIQLPQDIESSQITATTANGLLVIVVPRRKRQAHNIPIASS